MLDWLKFWKWDDNTCNQITALCAISALISWTVFRDFVYKMICKIITEFKNLRSKFKQFRKNLRSKIINKLREIAVGKENLELLKELGILRDNKWAIKFFKELKDGEIFLEDMNLNIRYDALMTLMEVYRLELDPWIHDPSPHSDSDSYDYLKEAYKKNDTYVRNAQINIFQKIIKNIVENNYNCYDNIHNKIDTLDKKNKYYIP